MSSPVASVATPAKKVTVEKVKKTTAAKPKATHPKFEVMITEAIKKLAEKTGSSKVAICKYITATYKIDEKYCNKRTKISLKSGLEKDMFKQSRGVGVTGSFKIGDAAKKAEIDAAKKAKAAEKASAKPKKVEKAKVTKKKEVKKTKTVAAKKAVATKTATKKSQPKAAVKSKAPATKPKASPVKSKASVVKAKSPAAKPKSAATKAKAVAKPKASAKPTKV